MSDRHLGVLLVSRIRQEIGGGHFVVARLANHFAHRPELRVKVCLLMNNYDDFVTNFVASSVPWYPFDVPASILSAKRQTKSLFRLLRSFITMISFFPSLTAKIRRICRDRNIHIVHVHAVRTFVLIALPVKFSGRKLLFHLHDAFLTTPEGGVFSPVIRFIVWICMRYLADHIVVNSFFVRQTLLDFDKSLCDKTTVVHNGIHVDSIRQHEIHEYRGGQPLITSYGVVARRKGFQTGIEAICILRHEYGVDAHYRIIGDGPFRQGLVDLARQLKVSDLVEFVGFQEQVHRYVAQADVVLIPSLYEEPFGLVVLEAMANSKIIIACRSGGIPEIMADVCDGYLTSKGNPHEIARRVSQIMADPKTANTVAERAYRRVKRQFSMEHMATRLVRVYRSM